MKCVLRRTKLEVHFSTHSILCEKQVKTTLFFSENLFAMICTSIHYIMRTHVVIHYFSLHINVVA